MQIEFTQEEKLIKTKLIKIEFHKIDTPHSIEIDNVSRPNYAILEQAAHAFHIMFFFKNAE